MLPYATEKNLRDYAFQMGVGDDIRHEDVLPRASEIIDLACDKPRGFFEPAPSTLSTKFFTPQTEKRLRVTPYVPGTIDYVDYVSMEAFTPEYTEIVDTDETRWLKAMKGDCWIPGEEVEISARWGWEQTPLEIVEATLELAIAIWRGRDTAYARVVADVNGGNTIFSALPDRTKLICEKWKRRRALVVA